MKKTILSIVSVLTIFVLAGCNSRFQHVDEFYIGPGDIDYFRFPLIEPYEVDRLDWESSWGLSLYNGLRSLPPDYYLYGHVEDVRKLSIKNGVIMVYSPYVDEQASQNVMDSYFHWFAVVPDKKIEAGFHKEEEFLEYIQQFGIQQPDWEETVVVYERFWRTGCLDWIPGCE